MSYQNKLDELLASHRQLDNIIAANKVRSNISHTQTVLVNAGLIDEGLPIFEDCVRLDEYIIDIEVTNAARAMNRVTVWKVSPDDDRPLADILSTTQPAYQDDVYIDNHEAYPVYILQTLKTLMFNVSYPKRPEYPRTNETPSPDDPDYGYDLDYKIILVKSHSSEDGLLKYQDWLKTGRWTEHGFPLASTDGRISFILRRLR